jgi:hypothetical protein
MTLQINDYRMMGDQLVRISDVLTNGSYAVEFIYVSVQGEAEAVTAGWAFAPSADCLTTIVDAKLAAAAQAFEANRQYELIDKQLDAAWQSVLKCRAALQSVCGAALAGAAA